MIGWIIYILTLPLQLYAALYCVLIFHELGHFLVDYATCGPITRVEIGSGRELFSFTFDGIQFRFCAIPDSGHTRLAWEPKRPWLRVASLLGGPLNNIMCFMLGWNDWRLFAALSLFVACDNLLSTERGSDGMQLREALREIWSQP